MPNPNSADRDAERKQARNLRNILNAEAKEAREKGAKAKAKGDKIGTASDPVDNAKGIDPERARVGHNLIMANKGVLDGAIAEVGNGLQATQNAWLTIGRTLILIRSSFVKDGEGKAGEESFDKKGFGAALDAAGYNTGRISSTQSRAEAMWFANNYDTITASAGMAERCLRFSNPTHIHSEYNRIKDIVANAKEEMNAEQIGEALKSSGGGAVTTPATKEAFRKDMRKRIAKRMADLNAPTDDGYRGSAKGWQLEIIVQELYKALDETISENVRLAADVADRNATIAKLRSEWNDGAIAEASFEVVASEVAPKPLALPAPDKAEAKPAKAKPAKAGKVKGGKAKVTKGARKAKPSGEDKADALAAKAKANRDSNAPTEAADAI